MRPSAPAVVLRPVVGACLRPVRSLAVAVRLDGLFRLPPDFIGPLLPGADPHPAGFAIDPEKAIATAGFGGLDDAADKTIHERDNPKRGLTSLASH